MNEEDKNFAQIISQLAKEATHEAYEKARKVMGEKGIVLARDGNIIRLYPDDSFDIIKKL